jgi:sugar transferase (PEP-CTERM/EpsH1 system associated)
MRILFVAQRVPYPPNRGDKIPNYHYIRHLSARHDVSVACLADGVDDLGNVQGLQPLCTDVAAVPLNLTRARCRALAALATAARPLTKAYFDEPKLRREIGDRLNRRQFDLAIVSSSGMAQFVERFDLPKVIQFTDLDSQKWRLYAQSSRFPKSWVYETEAARLLKYERQITRTFDYSLFCSDRELADFQRLIPGAPGRSIRNGVDLDYFRPGRATKNEQNLIFTGVMNYRPNVEGVDWFCSDVFPCVRAKCPTATFTICGANPDKAVRRLSRIPGVVVTGAVPDVRPYLASSSVAVVPLRMARGIQNKLIEAMAMGLPTVATTAAFDGIAAQAGSELFVADEATEFADAIVRLLHDHQLRAQVGAAARAAVEANYHWDRSLAALDDVIDEVMASRQRKPLLTADIVA